MWVLMRAICLRTVRISALLSSDPVALRKRRLSASCLVARSSSMSASMSSSVSSWFDLAISVHLLAGDDAGLDRQLLHGLLEGRLGLLLVGERELEQHSAGLDDGDPQLGVALAGTHAGLGRLLGDRLVREHVDPHLAAALDGAGHGDAGSLDLAGGQPTGLERLDAVLAEGQAVATLGH